MTTKKLLIVLLCWLVGILYFRFYVVPHVLTVKDDIQAYQSQSLLPELSE